ncbi:MAG: cysteine desulfurase [Acholeplasmataceae bacterium]|jgi:cysteine desulfurase/selenocysteine lyase|nr:cysteine desulfurase [Acholeplasmataceae bacterium]
MSLKIKELKKNFPIFEHNPNLIYLDTTASSLKNNLAIEAVNHYYSHYGVNVHRGVYNLSYEATKLYEDARETIANFINARNDEIIFTRGTTASLNMIAASYLSKLKPGDEIITSELEHHSSFLPWLNVSKKTGAKLKFVKLNEYGDLTVEEFKKVLTNKTKVVALTYISNVMGRIQPIKPIIELAKQQGAFTLIDAAQASAHFKIDVEDLGCDALAFSGHKMTGPTGIGVLYLNNEVGSSIEPIEFGGEMVQTVEKDSAIYKQAPIKFEAGTPIISGAIGLGKTVEFILNIGFDKIENHIKKIYDYTIDKLRKIDGITIYNKKSDTGIITFNIDDVHPHDAATLFDKNGISIRAGEHCAQLIVKWLGQTATLRASFYIYNDYADANKFISTVIETRDFFRKF